MADTWDDLLDVPGEPATDDADWRRAVLDAAKAKLDAWTEEQKEISRLIAVRNQAENILNYRESVKLAEQLAAERSGAEDTWLEKDLNDAFDRPQLQPDVGAFILGEKSNGGGVFYSGKLNEVHGPSESGKTMLALVVAAHEIRNGHHVIMIDFEDDEYAIVARLHWVFGLTRQEITTQFHYFRPAAVFGDAAFERIAAIEGVTLCIIDAVTEALAADGLDGRREDEVAAWFAAFPKRLTRLGMAVCLVDHTPGSDASRAIGSQHKKAAVDGVSYTAESVNKFARGRSGQLRIKVAKDKPGGVRPDALPQQDGQEWRGDLRIDGTQDPTHPRVGLWGVEPALLHGGDKDDSHLDRGVMPGGPTDIERKQVLVALERGPEGGMSSNLLCTYIGGRKEKIRSTLEWMRSNGEVLWVKEGNSFVHHLPPPDTVQVQDELE